MQNNTGLENHSQFVRESETALMGIMPRGNLLVQKYTKESFSLEENIKNRKLPVKE